MQHKESLGETRVLAPDDYVWLKGLLRYTHTAVVGTSSRHFTPSGVETRDPYAGVPNMPSILNGFSSLYRPGQLSFVFKSFRSTDHAGYIEEETAFSGCDSPLPNVKVRLFNAAANDIGLAGIGRAVPVAEADIEDALVSLNISRDQKGRDDQDLNRRNPEAGPHALYEVSFSELFVEGERFSLNGNHVSDGHPTVDPQQLLNFETLPPLPDVLYPPASRAHLARHLGAGMLV